MNVVTCDELKNQVLKGAKLVDVREPMELMGGKLLCAINVPMSLITQVSEMFDPKDNILVYCNTGRRSSQAAYVLNHMGYENVSNVGGVVHYPDCLEPIC